MAVCILSTWACGGVCIEYMSVWRCVYWVHECVAVCILSTWVCGGVYIEYMTVWRCVLSTWAGKCIWRALFQNALSDNPKIDVAMPMPSSEIIFWKRILHKYVDIYAYTHMWKACYQNTTIGRGICIASSFSGMALNAVWKRALYMYGWWGDAYVTQQPIF